MSELDRRSFIGALSLTLTASSLPGWNLWARSPEAGMWHVDDMWGHMPRYAQPISCEVVHVSINWDDVDPVDRALVT
jgi:hypothetical protein